MGPAPTYAGWDKPFVNDLPLAWLSPGENVLAVQVISKSPDTASGMTGGVAVVGLVPK